MGNFTPKTENSLETFTIPKAGIPELVKRYCAALEIGQTTDWCKCEWQIHPDDVAVPVGGCRNCGEDKSADYHHEDNPEGHLFQGKRMRRKDNHPDCPVHTREGLVLGFFEWLFPKDGHPGLSGPVPSGNFFGSLMKTPKEWLAIKAKGVHSGVIQIIDCDGWTFAEWEAQAPITIVEFERRLASCTVDYGNPNDRS
jgi:hypothetical protein